MKSFANSLAYFLLVVFFSAGVSNSQVITATLVGKVTDQTSAVVPGVTVTIFNQSTGFKRSVVSDNNGDYVLASIPVGNYQVTAELKGFKKALFDDISLEVGQTPRLDIGLTVGEPNQQLEVSATVPLIKTDTSDIGMVVSNQQLIDIPLNGRKLLDLNLLDSAASRISNFRNDPASPRSQNLGLANVSFNGSSSDGNVYLVDGIQSEGLQTTHMTYQPTLESVAEFKQQSNQYDASSGFGGGAQINIVTKSGTNT